MCMHSAFISLLLILHKASGNIRKIAFWNNTIQINHPACRTLLRYSYGLSYSLTCLPHIHMHSFLHSTSATPKARMSNCSSILHLQLSCAEEVRILYEYAQNLYLMSQGYQFSFWLAIQRVSHGTAGAGMTCEWAYINELLENSYVLMYEGSDWRGGLLTESP